MENLHGVSSISAEGRGWRVDAVKAPFMGLSGIALAIRAGWRPNASNRRSALDFARIR